MRRRISTRGSIATIRTHMVIGSILMCLCGSATDSLAQRGRGEQTGLTRQGFQPTMVSLVGKIDKVKIGPCEMTTGRAVNGVHAIVTTPKGTTLNLHLGPEGELKKFAEQFSIGKQVTVEAFRTPLLPTGQYIVRWIEVNGKKTVLRGPDLRPVWAGNARAAGTRVRRTALGWGKEPAKGYIEESGPSIKAKKTLEANKQVSAERTQLGPPRRAWRRQSGRRNGRGRRGWRNSGYGNGCRGRRRGRGGRA